MVKLGEFYYPWQGEDSIDYSLDNALHKVNGGNVGVNLSSCDEESLVISHPEDLITIRLDIKKIARINRFPGLRVASIQTDYLDENQIESMESIPSDINLYLIIDNFKNTDLSGLYRLSNLKGLHVNLLDSDNAEFKKFAELKHLRILCVHLTRSNVNGAAMSWLKDLKDLRVLELDGFHNGMEITNTGLAYLGKLKNLEELKISVAPQYYWDTRSCDYRIQTRNEKDDENLFDKFIYRLISIPGGVSAGKVTSWGWRHIARLQRLRILSLSHIKLDENALEYLRTTPSLREFELNDVAVNMQGLHSLQNLEKLERLKFQAGISTCLALTSENDHGPPRTYIPSWEVKETLQSLTHYALVCISPLEQIKVLDLSNGYLPDRYTGCSSEFDVQLSCGPYLRVLDVGNDRAGADMTNFLYRWLLVSPDPCSLCLQELRLNATSFSDSNLVRLKECLSWPNCNLFPNLRKLNLSNTQITDFALRYLLEFNHLQILDLEDTYITDEGVQYLERLSSLKQVNMEGTGVTSGRVARFKETSPGCQTPGWFYPRPIGVELLYAYDESCEEIILRKAPAPPAPAWAGEKLLETQSEPMKPYIVVEVKVDTTGQVISAEPRTASKFPFLDKWIAEPFFNWKFKPHYHERNLAVEVEVRLDSPLD